MKTNKSIPINTLPEDHPFDGSAINIPLEENLEPEEKENANEEAEDLDEDIMMYMINI